MDKLERDVFDDLLGLAAKLEGVPKSRMAAMIARRQEEDRRRVERANQRYAAAVDQMSSEQRERIEALKQKGWKLQSALRQSKSSGKVVRFLHTTAWNPQRSAVGPKMAAVYPDGSVVMAFGKSISVRSDF